MIEPSSEESSKIPPSEGKPEGARKKVVIARPSTAGSPLSQKRPVVVRHSGVSKPKPLRVNRETAKQSFKTAPKVSRGNSARKPAARLGQPDFASSIVSNTHSRESRKRKASSIHQRLFFDTAIAVVTLSFMVLTFLHL